VKNQSDFVQIKKGCDERFVLIGFRWFEYPMKTAGKGICKNPKCA
jgi:hypothetical protein